MKKIAKALLLILTLCAVCMLASADRDTYVSGASIRVSMISQSPDPVEPGDNIELRWMVTNYGSTPLENLQFRIIPDYPFNLLGSDDGIVDLGTIQGHQKGEEGVVLYYKIGIDDDASEGVNNIILEYRYDGIEWARLDNFDIRIQSIDAAIVIEDVRVEPSRIPPGQNGKIHLKIRNLADSLMENVNVKMDLTLSSIPQPATGMEVTLLFEALPFAPTASSSEKRIQSIKPGEFEVITFDITAYPDATSRIYKVPIVMTYRDEIGAEFEKNDIVGIVVGSAPDLYVVIDQSNLLAGQKTGTVSFKFVNKGVTDIKFLDIQLEDTDDYDVVSAREEYIGNIDSDDFETVDFDVYMTDNSNSEQSSVIDFPLKITFKDANNVDYSQDLVVKHKIFTAKEKGESKSNSGVLIVVVIAIMIVVWLAYRRWSKHRKKK
ncbi:hypothetical protein HQ545_07170 [Candidatus Woesearchaeota archaeon]|nr:hypothetical protein [Candidatus Woesearchaeota archaeon]